MYKIKSLELADDIEMQSGKTWYRYIIANEYSTINGLRAGSRAEVLQHARLCTMTLNKKYKSGKVKLYKPVNNNVFFKL